MSDTPVRAGFVNVSGTSGNRVMRPTSRKRGSSSVIGSLAFALVAAIAAPVHAEEATGSCAALMDANNAPSTDPRVEHLTVDGVHVNVMLPPGYHGEHRRYPVLYLFHGAFSDEDSFTTQTDLLAFTAHMRGDEQVIAVMPDGGHLPAGRDWVDGTHHQETFVINSLLPYVDSHYRTYADGAHRAAAGFSAGGMNAMVFASRHPELFAAAGSFSGFVDQYSDNGIGVVDQFAELDNELCGATNDPNGIWGDPAVHPMGWEGHDPVYLAAGLKHLSVYVASSNGVPCADQASPDPFLVFAEGVVYQMSQSFDQALSSAGVRHVTEFRTCGIHLFSNANQDLRSFWPLMLDAFGTRPPSQFDYRTGDATASAYGWSFTADPSRAPEFLGVRSASDDGMQLTGSGRTAITTGQIFGRHALVTVGGSGLGTQTVRADDAGRITFSVDLGPAHSLEQATAAELAAAAANPNYFVTRNVRFSSGCDDGRGDSDRH